MPIVNAKTTFLLKAQNFKKAQKNVMIVSLFQIILKSILRFWSFRYVKEVLAFFFLLSFPPLSFAATFLSLSAPCFVKLIS